MSKFLVFFLKFWLLLRRLQFLCVCGDALTKAQSKCNQNNRTTTSKPRRERNYLFIDYPTRKLNVQRFHRIRQVKNEKIFIITEASSITTEVIARIHDYRQVYSVFVYKQNNNNVLGFDGIFSNWVIVDDCLMTNIDRLDFL